MVDSIMSLFFATWAPYYIYKSFKRDKLTKKLAGITSGVAALIVIVGTRPPINLKPIFAILLLALFISLELFLVAYKEKNSFLTISGFLVLALALYIFLFLNTWV